MATATPRRTMPRVQRQRYSWWQTLRAGLYDRLPLIGESLLALALIVLVMLVDIFVQLQTSPAIGLDSALLNTLLLLALQVPSSLANTAASHFLLACNILFSVLFAQSVLNSIRALFRKRDPQVRQIGLTITLRDHVIVCGLGRVGLRVVTRLTAAGFKAAIIEQDWDAELVPRALQLGVPVVVGDAREPTILRRAGLMRACAVIASIDGDLVNVEIALAARAERPDIRMILRAFNEEFDRGLERSFGPDSAFSASALAAPTFAAATVSRYIEHVLPLDHELLGITSFFVPAPSQQWAFTTARALEDHFGVRVLRQSPRARAAGTLTSGAQLTVLGPLSTLEDLQQIGLSEMAAGVSTQPPLLHLSEQFDTVIICGLGKVGYRVVLLLHPMRPRPRIVVIHRDDAEASFSKQIRELDGVITVLGDAREAETLAQADLHRAFAIAAVTSDDLTNLQIGLEARRMRPDAHVVLRVFSDTLAEKLVDLFGIHTTYSTSDLASPTLAAAAVLGGISHAFFTDGHLYAMETVTARAGDWLTGHSVEALRKQYDALIVGLGAGAAMQVLPSHERVIAQGETVTLVAQADTLAKLARHKLSAAS